MGKGIGGKGGKPIRIKHPKHAKRQREKEEALKSELLKTAYSQYSESYMRTHKTDKVPRPITVDDLKQKIMPYIASASDEMPAEIYDVIPSLAGSAGGAAYGPKGQIAGEIGGQMFSEFLKWGIEDDGFELIVDFVKDTVEDIKDFLSDVGSVVEDVWSDVGSAFGFW